MFTYLLFLAISLLAHTSTKLIFAANQCQTNEVFSNCVNNVSNATNCYFLKWSVPCNFIKPVICLEGCLCQAGFTRNYSGNCVPVNTCPSDPCPNPNEELSCYTSCPPQTCQSIGKTYNCPLQNGSCQTACRCKGGFFRNSNGICVSKADCLPDNSVDVAKFEQGNYAFTGEFLYQLSLLHPGNSFAASPFSVLMPVAQLGLFAVGLTLEQILEVLNLENKAEISSVFPTVIHNYQSQQLVQVLLASKYYTDQKFPLTDNFQQQSQQVFGAEGENVDFGNPTETADIINSWVNEATNGSIPTLVSPSMFDATTRLVLANAIYFKGSWEKVFDSANTIDRDFFPDNSNNSVPTSTMFQEGTFIYDDSVLSNTQCVQLLYKDNNISCLIILPPKVEDGLKDLIKALRDGTILPQILEALSLQRVRIFLPIFDIMTQTDLVDMLVKTNVGNLVNPDSNDLQGILEDPTEPLYVSDAIQKCRIKLNENGTEAAAANAFEVSAASAVFPDPPIVDFVADHTFLFCILLENEPIFVGCYSGPE